MTREEILDWLCRLRSGLVWFDVPPKERPMFEDALSEEIEALSAEPCDDAISRQATVERLCKVAEFINEKRDGLGSPYIMAALFIQDNKDEFPSVTPKQKMGHWEWVQYDSNPEIGNFHCSECNFISASFNWASKHLNYCPNCGAKMQEVDE